MNSRCYSNLIICVHLLILGTSEQVPAEILRGFIFGLFIVVCRLLSEQLEIVLDAGLTKRVATVWQ